MQYFTDATSRHTTPLILGNNRDTGDHTRPLHTTPHTPTAPLYTQLCTTAPRGALPSALGKGTPQHPCGATSPPSAPPRPVLPSATHSRHKHRRPSRTQRIAAERPLPAALGVRDFHTSLHLRTALVTTGCRPSTPESHAQCRGSAHCEAPSAHCPLHSAPPTPASAPVHRHPLPDRAISSHADTLPHAAWPCPSLVCAGPSAPPAVYSFPFACALCADCVAPAAPRRACACLFTPRCCAGLSVRPRLPSAADNAAA